MAGAALGLGTAPPASAAPVAHAVTLAGQQPAWAISRLDTGRIADQRIGHMTVHLQRTADKQRAFEALLAAQQTPGSPQFHHWLTAAQIGQQFGPSDADVAQVTAWLAAQGLDVTRVAASKMFVEVRTTTAKAEAAFHVEMHGYKVGGKTLRALDRAPVVPAELAGIVRGVSGLADVHPSPQFRRPAAVDSNGLHYVGVSDFAKIYDLAPVYANSITGAGETIGIIGRSRVLAADYTNFGVHEGVTLPTLNTVIPTGGVDPGTPCSATNSSCASEDDQAEATLDVQRVGSIAVGSKVELIAATSDNMGDDGVEVGLFFAIDSFGTASDANIVTMSFGLCEDFVTPSGVSELDALYQQAAAQGQSVFVSSGDAGAGGCNIQGGTPEAGQALGVNGLCSSSSATCVGGTEYADFANPATFWDASGNVKSYIPEGAWNDPLDSGGNPVALGGGGGISVVIAKPSYQNGVGPVGNTFRMVPDVSFTASVHDPYLVCMSAFSAPCSAKGSTDFTGFGGTSASAPSMAAVMALITQSQGTNQGLANPALYRLGAVSPTVFHDTTVASSGVASCDVAVPSMCNNSDPGPASLTSGALPGFLVSDGYDEATGWGTLDVAAVVNAWVPVVEPTLVVSPNDLTVTAGDSATATATAKNFAGAVTLSCSGLPLGAACAFAGATMTISTTAPHDLKGAAGVIRGGDGGSGAGRAWLFVVFGAGALALVMLRGRKPRAVVGAVVVSSALALASCGSGNKASQDGRQADASHAADAAEHDSGVDGKLLDGGGSITPVGQYNITVTATDGTTTLNAGVVLNVD